MTAARQPDVSDPIERVIAVALCNADETWEHHDQTDDHPCSRCLDRAAKVREALQPTLDAAQALADESDAEWDAAWERATERALVAERTVAAVRALMEAGEGRSTMVVGVSELRAALTPPQQGRQDEGALS